ncbi:DUF7793 family protein [Demequina lutea]|uniref:DUF7793 domain-containing protein n=1 Tax=Demequina lutea TaxID=431489 RepID=A0A7Y9Z9U1_9MICO|nr:hypothetical protein [Demequina lutea]NYI41469.1 hypothetical protein [Demequina lutea]
MSGDSSEMAHPKFRIWLRPDGIAQCVWASGVATTLEDAIASTSALVELTGGRRVPLLVEPGEAATQDRAARLEFARQAENVSALALIVHSPLSRIMGNLFANVHQAVAPTQLFDDEDSAVAWLKQFTA